MKPFERFPSSILMSDSSRFDNKYELLVALDIPNSVNANRDIFKTDQRKLAVGAKTSESNEVPFCIQTRIRPKIFTDDGIVY